MTASDDRVWCSFHSDGSLSNHSYLSYLFVIVKYCAAPTLASREQPLLIIRP